MNKKLFSKLLIPFVAGAISLNAQNITVTVKTKEDIKTVLNEKLTVSQIEKMSHEEIINFPAIKIIDILGEEKGQKLIQEHFLVELNKYRKSKGLKTLVLNEKLNNITTQFAKENHKLRHFSHVSKEGQTLQQRLELGGYDTRYGCENIGWGDDTIYDILNTRIESPGHNKNLLSKKVEDIGISFYKTYWVLNLGREQLRWEDF